MAVVIPLPDCGPGQVTLLLLEKSGQLLDVGRLPVALLHQGLIHNADEYAAYTVKMIVPAHHP